MSPQGAFIMYNDVTIELPDSVIQLLTPIIFVIHEETGLEIEHKDIAMAYFTLWENHEIKRGTFPIDSSSLAALRELIPQLHAARVMLGLIK